MLCNWQVFDSVQFHRKLGSIRIDTCDIGYPFKLLPMKSIFRESTCLGDKSLLRVVPADTTLPLTGGESNLGSLQAAYAADHVVRLFELHVISPASAVESCEAFCSP